MQSQFAIYFEDGIARPDDILWKSLSGQVTEKFDETPIILPVPNEPALAEVPIVQVSSKNEAFRLNISRKRLDFFIYGKGKSASFKDSKDILLRSVKIFVRETKSITKIKWIGSISNFFIEIKSPELYIGRFINNKFMDIHEGNTLEATVDYISKIRGLDISLNNHTRLQAAIAKFKDTKEESTGVIVSRDINTKSQENSKDFINEEFAEKFIDFAEKNFKLNEIMSLWKE